PPPRAAGGAPAGARAADICARPPDHVVEAADKAAAASLAQRYGALFGAEQAGARVLLRSRPDDPAQQRELAGIAADPRYRLREEARFELDGGTRPDPLQFHNAALWKAIRMPAPRRLQPGEPVDVAVLDGPVRGDHPDLPEVVQIRPRLRDEDGRCDGGDCCPQVAAGEGTWHATRVAGLIGARRGNGIGMAGIAPVRRIVSINASVGGCIGEFSLAAALHCAIEYRDPDDRRVRVANISMGSLTQPASLALSHALQRARNEDLLVVASAGNDGVNINSTTRWPSSLNEPNILTVEVRDYDGNAIGGMNYGFGTVDIGAPAPPPYATKRRSICTASVPLRGPSSCSGDYASFERTSAAAAVVSGAAALVWSDRRYAACTAEQMSELLRSSRSHCIAGHSYRQNRDVEVCQLDLGFLSQRNSPLQALCAGGNR
uniref:S8 family serine peptidase n=1 Tax=Tahibacter caeni TaxID=1453545 RepID=UPI0021475D98